MRPPASVTVTESGWFPRESGGGVPVMAPVEALRERPVGRPVMAKESGDLPLLAWRAAGA